MKSVKAADGVYRQEFTHCNKERCKKCQEGAGHGPYWYRYWWEEGKTRKKYVGKELPPNLITEDITEEPITEDLTEDEALPKTPQKTDAQVCPKCGLPLGDNLSRLEGHDGKIYHKKCRAVEKPLPSPPSEPTVAAALVVIKAFHDKGIEPTAAEVAEAVGMESRPLGRLMKEAGVQAQNVHRGGVKARRYTFDLKPKIEELLAIAGELEE